MSATPLLKICKQILFVALFTIALLKLIAGAIVKSATNPVYRHSCFNMDSEIASSFNIYIVLGAASSSDPPISKVTPPEAEGGRMTRSLIFANRGEKLRENKKSYLH